MPTRRPHALSWGLREWKGTEGLRKLLNRVMVSVYTLKVLPERWGVWMVRSQTVTKHVTAGQSKTTGWRLLYRPVTGSPLATQVRQWSHPLGHHTTDREDRDHHQDTHRKWAKLTARTR